MPLPTAIDLMYPLQEIRASSLLYYIDSAHSHAPSKRNRCSSYYLPISPFSNVLSLICYPIILSYPLLPSFFVIIPRRSDSQIEALAQSALVMRYKSRFWFIFKSSRRHAIFRLSEDVKERWNHINHVERESYQSH